MLKAVIFDFGGVLLRTTDKRPRTMLADMLGVTYADVEFQVFNSESGRAAQLGRITPEENWENVRRHYNLKPDEMEYFQLAFMGGDTLDIELVNYIRALRPAYRTALLSNNLGDLRPQLADRWQIADAFDEIVISAELGMMKPGPRIYQVTLEKLGVAPHEAVFIDDFQHNLQGAQAVGIPGLLFQNRAQLLSDLATIMNAGNPPTATN